MKHLYRIAFVLALITLTLSILWLCKLIHFIVVVIASVVFATYVLLLALYKQERDVKNGR